MMNFDGYDYEVHDLTENGQTYPIFPFIVNIPFYLFYT